MDPAHEWKKCITKRSMDPHEWEKFTRWTRRMKKKSEKFRSMDPAQVKKARQNNFGKNARWTRRIDVNTVDGPDA